MSKTREEQKKILLKHSKEEIIDALLYATGSTFFIDDVLHKLWRIKSDRLYEVMMQASNEDTKALQAYVDFEKSLAEKYGKDGKFNLNAIPSQDFKKLQDLLMEWQKVNKKYEKANKELDRFYKEESL